MKAISLAALACLVAAAPQDPEKDRLRQALGDNDLVGTWIYDDLPAGYAEAKKSGKPLMAVIRCVP
jgi:serine protease Do